MQHNIFIVYGVTLFNAVKENIFIFQIFFISVLSKMFNRESAKFLP
jgi:hypothetical protein